MEKERIVDFQLNKQWILTIDKQVVCVHCGRSDYSTHIDLESKSLFVECAYCGDTVIELSTNHMAIADVKAHAEIPKEVGWERFTR